MIQRLALWFGKLTPWDDHGHGHDTIERSIQVEATAEAAEQRAHLVADRMERETGHFWRDALRGAVDTPERYP